MADLDPVEILNRLTILEHRAEKMDQLLEKHDVMLAALTQAYGELAVLVHSLVKTLPMDEDQSKEFHKAVLDQQNQLTSLLNAAYDASDDG